MNNPLQFLDHVDMRTLSKVAEKLKASRNKKEQAVGAFLARVYTFRTEGPLEMPAPDRESTSLFDGLRDIN